MIDAINKIIQLHDGSVKEVSDGYHTFQELYDFRMLYNAALFKFLPPECKAHRTKRHNDKELCFGGGHFKVSAMTPKGEISNHYKLKYWDLFDFLPEEEFCLFEYDEHTSQDVLERIKSLL